MHYIVPNRNFALHVNRRRHSLHRNVLHQLHHPKRVVLPFSHAHRREIIRNARVSRLPRTFLPLLPQLPTTMSKIGSISAIPAFRTTLKTRPRTNTPAPNTPQNTPNRPFPAEWFYVSPFLQTLQPILRSLQLRNMNLDHGEEFHDELVVRNGESVGGLLLLRFLQNARGVRGERGNGGRGREGGIVGEREGGGFARTVGR